MSEAEDQRFAPPQAHVADVATGEVVLANRGTRFVAALVDGIIVACVIWAVLMIPALRPLVEAQQKASVAGFSNVNIFSVVVGLAGFLLVQGWPLLTRGQTVGKMLFKLRIVRTDGSSVDPVRLLGLRYGIGILMNINVGISMIWGLVDSLLIFRESRRCLHDSIADTQVIKL